MHHFLQSFVKPVFYAHDKCQSFSRCAAHERTRLPFLKSAMLSSVAGALIGAVVGWALASLQKTARPQQEPMHACVCVCVSFESLFFLRGVCRVPGPGSAPEKLVDGDLQGGSRVFSVEGGQNPCGVCESYLRVRRRPCRMVPRTASDCVQPRSWGRPDTTATCFVGVSAPSLPGLAGADALQRSGSERESADLGKVPARAFQNRWDRSGSVLGLGGLRAEASALHPPRPGLPQLPE